MEQRCTNNARGAGIRSPRRGDDVHHGQLQDIEVRGHHALGVTRGPTGIQLEERFVFIHRNGWAGRGKAGYPFVPVQAVGLVGCDNGHAGRQLGAQRGERRFHARQNQQYPGAGVADNIRQFRRGQPVVERDGDGAHFAGGHEKQAVFYAVLAQDCDPLPFLYAQPEKAVAQLIGTGVDLAEAHRRLVMADAGRVGCISCVKLKVVMNEHGRLYLFVWINCLTTTRSQDVSGQSAEIHSDPRSAGFQSGCLPGPARRWSLRGPHQWVLAGQRSCPGLAGG